jgi:ferredoxin
MTYLPVIGESACLAHGDCEELAPDVFRVEDVATILSVPHPESSSSRSPKRAPPPRSAWSMRRRASESTLTTGQPVARGADHPEWGPKGRSAAHLSLVLDYALCRRA